MSALTTLAGRRAIVPSHVSIPAWGCSFAEITLDQEVTLAGRVELVMAGLRLQGTILSGGPSKGRSRYRVVAGAGGWGQRLPKRAYANDALVRIATVLNDAAAAVGETIDPATLDGTRTVGPAFVRPEGDDVPASSVLEQLAPQAWYVGEDGVTRLGRRPKRTLDAAVPRVTPVDHAAAMVTLAPSSLAAILPGVVVDGLEAVDVEHSITAEGLRTKIYGALGASGLSRELAALKAIADQLDPRRKFRGITEYRVVTLEGKRMNLQPVQVSTGMPNLRRVLARPGVPGCYGEVALGSRVYVAFINADPSHPAVTGFEDAEGDGFVPVLLELAGGAAFAARADKVATELSALASKFNTHTHLETGGTTNAVVGPQQYTPGSVASSKVKVT